VAQKEKDLLMSVAVKVPKRTYDKIERFRQQMAKRFPGSKPSLSDAVRAIFEKALP
jgi:hypothetical protein